MPIMGFDLEFLSRRDGLFGVDGFTFDFGARSVGRRAVESGVRSVWKALWRNATQRRSPSGAGPGSKWTAFVDPVGGGPLLEFRCAASITAPGRLAGDVRIRRWFRLGELR